MTKRQTPVHKARKEAAAELGVEPNDRRAIRLATLLLAYDQVHLQQAAGRVVDIAHVLKLDSAIAEVRQATTTPPQINFQYVETIDHCPQCGFRRASLPEAPETSRRDTERASDHGNAIAGPPESDAPSAPVEPEAPRPLWADTGYVPAQDGFSSNAIVKTGAEPWRSHVRLGGGAPNPSPRHILTPDHHRLPQPNKFNGGS